MHLEYWVIIIAQHFSISPMEVYKMPPDMVKRTLGWVMAIQDERKRMRDEQNKGGSSSTETVSLDYSAWFDDEGI